jgi:hypothetical protein
MQPAAAQARRPYPAPQVATSLVPQATGQHPEDAAARKDGTDENRRCPPIVPGIGKNRRTTDRVRNGDKVRQAVIAHHSRRYEERQNSKPEQPVGILRTLAPRIQVGAERACLAG